MIFGKFSRPFGRAMQIPEERGMRVRVKFQFFIVHLVSEKTDVGPELRFAHFNQPPLLL